MIFSGIIIPEGIKYVKFHNNAGRGQVTINDSLKSIDIYGKYSTDQSELSTVSKVDLPHNLEYIKVPSYGSLVTSGIRITKLIYEDLVIDIHVVKTDEDRVYQELISVAKAAYNRILILIKDTEATPTKLADLLAYLPTISVEVLDPTVEVTSIHNVVIQNSHRRVDGYNHPTMWNNTIAQLDWSQSLEKLLSLVYEDIKEYYFSEPTPKLAQFLNERPNTCRYELGPLEYDNRGHLVGRRWKYFSQNKMKVDFEFLCTDTPTYYKLLYDIKTQIKVVNIANYQVIDNYGHQWDVACTWELPNEESLTVTESSGSNDTAGDAIRVSAEMHFFTISKPTIGILVEEILLEISTLPEIIINQVIK